MPRKNGKKIKGNKLGSSLIKDKNRRKVKRKKYIQENRQELLDSDVRTGKRALHSVLEMDSVSDFLYRAELSQKQFDVNQP